VSSVFISGKTFRFLRDRLQHVGRCGVIAKSLAHVDEEVFVSGRKHKAAAELQRILPQAMLLVSGGLRTAAGLHVVPTQQVKQGSVAQADSFVGLAFVIDQKRELDAVFFAKEFGVARVAQSNGGQVGAFPLELFFEFAQLRDMLSAEDSTIVAKEDQHGRSALPQRTEARGISVDIW
jgi:hypothetical protein